MSMIVARMEKKNTQNLGGMQKHNQREFENHSNKEIDTSRSHLNYDLMNAADIDYREKIMGIIESQKTGTRKIRKDAVLVNEWIITSDQKFFKGMDPDDFRDFFREATNWFKERYGEQNIAFATVHLDETTPHMHLGVVPMRDGRLQAKNVFNRKELLEIQKELPIYLSSKSFAIERGLEGSKSKHLKVTEYKEMVQDLEEMKQEKKEVALETIELASEAKEEREGIKALSEDYKALESKYVSLSDSLEEVKRELQERKIEMKQMNKELEYASKVHNERLMLENDIEGIKSRTSSHKPLKARLGAKEEEEQVKLSKKDFERLINLAERGVTNENYIQQREVEFEEAIQKYDIALTESINDYSGLAKDYNKLLGNYKSLYSRNQSLEEKYQGLIKNHKELEKENQARKQFIMGAKAEEQFKEWNKQFQKKIKQEQNRGFDIGR